MILFKKKGYDVAIVGAGFSGAMIATHLASLSPQLRVVLIDKAGTFGLGVAYGTDDPQHLLNVPASKMSAFSDEPDHFLKWLETHPTELLDRRITAVSPDAFLPRQVYGQYVRQIFDQTRQ